MAMAMAMAKGEKATHVQYSEALAIPIISTNERFTLQIKKWALFHRQTRNSPSTKIIFELSVPSRFAQSPLNRRASLRHRIPVLFAPRTSSYSSPLTYTLLSRWHRRQPRPARQRSTPLFRRSLPTRRRSSAVSHFTPDSPWLVLSAVQSLTEVSHLLMCKSGLCFKLCASSAEHLNKPSWYQIRHHVHFADPPSAVSKQEYNLIPSHTTRGSLEDSGKSLPTRAPVLS